MDEELKKLYRKYSKKGLGNSYQKQLDRVALDADPIVKEIARISKIDMEAYLPGSGFSNDKILLFTALLVANHPKIAEGIRNIRKDIGLHQLLKYTKKYNEEVGDFTNTTLIDLEGSVKEKLENFLDLFFADIGKNLQREDWNDEISTYILSDILPLPFMPRNTFQISRNQNKLEINESTKYPVIVIKKRIKKRELNQLVEFIEEHERELIKATSNLPFEPVKRSDVDLTKLAIGLWVYKNDNLGNAWMEGFINDKNDENEKYFGAYSDGLGKADFPNLKSDALGYLNQFYPL
jgi:hypothetical protein